jgi:hypothetical protein
MLPLTFIPDTLTSKFFPYSALCASSFNDVDSFDSPADLGILRWAYKWTREFARRMDTFRGELAGGHPEFPAGSKAAAKTTTLGPDPIDSPKIVYTTEDDAAIDDYHRDKGLT